MFCSLRCNDDSDCAAVGGTCNRMKYCRL
jgi:hypothetical protein